MSIDPEILKYLSLPVISAVVGYVTNLVAIRMMFYPVEFVGLKPPWLGWQGVVPRKCAKMAGVAVDTITTRLITQEEIFERLDPERIAQELEGPLNEMVHDITEAVMREHQPRLWDSLPEALRQRVIRRVQAEAPTMVAEVMDEVRENIHQIFDLKDMVITSLVRDKTLLNRIFLETGETEFRFIARSGLYFGFLFGLIQMTVWWLYPAWWLLPAFGLLVGYATNWLALKMIFNPKRPWQFGPVAVQGLFFKRQSEVAHDYGNLVSDEILTPANILEAVLRGPYADKLFALVQRHVQRVVDESASVARPFVAWTVGTESYERMKASAVDHVLSQMPEALQHVTDYAEDAMRIRETLVGRLQGLDPVGFERMLRPAFEEDEWLLIAVGAALGFAVGWFQLVFVFGEEFARAFG